MLKRTRWVKHLIEREQDRLRDAQFQRSAELDVSDRTRVSAVFKILIYDKFWRNITAQIATNRKRHSKARGLCNGLATFGEAAGAKKECRTMIKNILINVLK